MKNLNKIKKHLSIHQYLTLCLVFVCVGLLFFGSIPHAQAGGPEERPLNALLGTSNLGNQYIGYTMGTSFTANADGYIDTLWGNIPANAATFYLYDTANQQSLASVSVTGLGYGTWTSGAISPVYVTSGHTYIVAVSKTGYVSAYSGATNYTTGNITINGSYYVNGLNAYPTTYGGGTYYGLADVSYHTGTPGGGATTTLGTGTEPSQVTISPGGASTEADSFTLQSSAGTDSVTSLVVNAPNYNALSEVRITSNDGSVTYLTAYANPGSSSVTLSGGTPIPVTTSSTQFKIKVTPKSHANMPAVPGAVYNATPTVSSFTSTNAQAGSDTNTTGIYIDNASPNSASPATGTAGNGKVTLNWTSSSSTDIGETVVLRWTSASVGAEVPAEGSTYSVGNTIGTATVACDLSAGISTAYSKIDGTGGDGSCGTAALTNGQAYSYKVFQRDTSGNFDAGVTFTGSPFTPSVGGAEERPLNAMIGTSNNNAQWANTYTMGTQFTVNADGYIDKLWANMGTGTATLYLFDSANSQLITSVTVSANSLGTWTSGSITPVAVTSGHTYLVAVFNTGYLSSYTGTQNYTTGNITLIGGYWGSGQGTYPTNPGYTIYYGLADISYHSGSIPAAYGLTSTQSGNFNVGTTWGGSCASSCVAGTDYPGTSQSVIIANGHTVTLTGNQTVAGATINSGGTLSLGSNTLTISGSGTPFVKNGTFTPGTGTIQYTNATSATVTATTYYNLTTGGTGTYTLASGTTTVTNSTTISSGATLSLSSNTLVLSGTGTPLTTTGTFTASTGTVQYTGSGGTINVTPTAYYNLTLGGAGTYTMPGSTVTMKGSLVVTNGATVTKGAGAIVFSGTSSQTITDNNATKQDLGAVQVSSGVSWCNISSTDCDSSWLYRRKITFDNSASSTNLTNFPVLVSLTSANVDYSKTQNSGQDIRFVDANNSTALSYEIEKWDESGTSLVWVKVPQIDAASAADFIYMYYGNVSATDNQTAVNTWSSSYVGVWHLKDGNTLSAADSLGINTATNYGATATTGVIDGGANFSGSAQSINLGNSATVQPTTGTASVWVNTSNAGAGYRGLIVKQGNYGVFMVDNVVNIYDWNAGPVSTGVSINNGAWRNVTFVFQMGVTNGSRIYIDGVAAGSAFTWNAAWNTTDLVLGAGSNDNSTQLLTGKLDEARVSSTARSADWIKAEYLTGSNTMNSFGSEESNGGAGVLMGSSIKVTSLTVGSATTFDVNGANTITLTGNNVSAVSPLVVNGTFTPSTGTVDFSSASTTGTTIPALNYYNLSMNKASNTFTAAGALTANNLTITAGTFVAPSGNLTINGNFSNSGSFTHNSGTVIFAPTTLTASITGTTTFNNLTDTAVGSTLQFTNGNTYTFAGTLTATGTSQNPIWLKSVSNGSQWTVTFSGSASLSYVNVMDGACSGGNTLSTNPLLYNFGNNGPCWNFIVRGGGGGGASGSDAQGNTSGHSSGGGGTGTGTSQATATAVRNGTTIQSVTVNNGGVGYTSVPGICFEDATGSGATAIATISGGVVTVITVTANGTNYTSGVIVGISAPPGTGGSGCSSNGGGTQGGGGASP